MSGLADDDGATIRSFKAAAACFDGGWMGSISRQAVMSRRRRRWFVS